MKTNLLLLMMVFTLNTMIAETPVNVASKFERDYPNTSGTWTAYKEYNRVEYHDKYTDTWRAIVYDNAGCVVCYDWKTANNSYHYPVRISDYYMVTYPGETYTVWSSLTPGGAQKGYYIIRNAEPIWFCSNGKIK